MSISKHLKHLKEQLPEHVTLVAVSKTKPVSAIQEAYDAGQRIFGENKIQELAEKYPQLPKDIQWHMIGHAQTNKIKYIAPFVGLIHGVDSLKLLKEINKQAKKHHRIINCLLQVKIAKEDSKFGLSPEETQTLLSDESLLELSHVKIIGLMGMATFTDNTQQLTEEFSALKTLYAKLEKVHNFTKLSMGMSGDYKLAITCGSNMIRVGSAIFGARTLIK